MTALQELLAKVEAGGIKTGRFLLLMRSVFPYHDIIAHEAYNGSLDAAKALHEAVLGVGFNYSIHKDSASVMTWAHTVEGKTITANNRNPARAWLIAIIEALIAQEKST